MSDTVLGSLFGLSCAVVWSLTVLLFKGVTEKISPNIFNFTKNFIALIFLTLTILIFDRGRIESVGTLPFFYLFVSGFVGLGFADSLFLYCLKKVGAGWMAIVETAYTPFVFLFSLVLLAESISIREAVGVIIIIGALLMINLESNSDKSFADKDFAVGIAAGILSLLLVAFGVVLTKVALAEVSLFYAVEIRLIGGVLGTAMLLLLRRPHLAREIQEIKNFPSKSKLIAISLFGTYLTLLLWIGGFKYQKATITAVLNQTSTVFTLFASVIFLKEKLTKTKVVVSVLAFIGVIITIS